MTDEDAAQPSAVPAQGGNGSPPLLPANAGSLAPADVERLKPRLAQAAADHDVPTDPWMFNGGTVMVLALTALAAFLPSLGAQAPTWLAPLCSGIAGLLVALERALGFGARWRYHREMRSAYESVIDMLEFAMVVPESERPRYMRDVYSALYAVRTRESAIPHAGSQAPPT